MSSASEILALHKKILPAKYDKKRQPNIIGTDELPFPICITQSQLKGGHHFHFQHGPYSRRFVMCARNYYSCNVQLTCMTRACSGRVNITPKNPNMIKCIGERESKEGKRQRIKKKYAIDWECPDTKLAENWKVDPKSVRAHCCKPRHAQQSTKDIFRALNSADSLEKRQNKTRENIKTRQKKTSSLFLIFFHLLPNLLTLSCK
jgi:hypothetical protein